MAFGGVNQSKTSTLYSNLRKTIESNLDSSWVNFYSKEQCETVRDDAIGKR